MATPDQSSPCLSCGACCAAYRVSFYWREAEPDYTPTPVPESYYEERGAHYRALKRHKNEQGLTTCVALTGAVGERVACEIYLNRPSPCKNFNYSWENGKHEPRCDEARAKLGLAPLKQNQ